MQFQEVLRFCSHNANIGIGNENAIEIDGAGTHGTSILPARTEQRQAEAVSSTCCIGGAETRARLYYLWLPGLVGRPSAACLYQPGVVAHLCNFATGGLVCWTVGRRGPLVVLDHVEPASALSAASAWAPRGSPWRPGGLESRAPGQALQGAAQTGRVVQ